MSKRMFIYDIYNKTYEAIAKMLFENCSWDLKDGYYEEVLNQIENYMYMKPFYGLGEYKHEIEIVLHDQVKFTFEVGIPGYRGKVVFPLYSMYEAVEWYSFIREYFYLLKEMVVDRDLTDQEIQDLVEASQTVWSKENMIYKPDQDGVMCGYVVTSNDPEEVKLFTVPVISKAMLQNFVTELVNKKVYLPITCDW